MLKFIRIFRSMRNTIINATKYRNKMASIRLSFFRKTGATSKTVFLVYMRDNASMFDFINIFTEYAKDLKPIKKIETEEKAGALADWIAKNKRKFDKTQKT